MKKRYFCNVSLLVGLAFVLLMATPAKAQGINMKDGTTTVSSTINFYDSQGPAEGSTNYWNSYYKHNEEFVHTFTPGTTGYKVKVTFNTFTAYGPNSSDPNTGESLGDWSVRLNDDFLYVYDGDRIDDTKLIAAYTGNSKQAFTVMATGSTGALTFVFKSNGQYSEEGWAAQVTQEAAATAQAPFIRRATCENEIEMLPTTLKAKIYYTTDGSTPSTSSTQYRRPIDFPAGSNLTVKAISTLSTGGNASTVSSETFTDSDRLTTPGVPTLSALSSDNTVTLTPPAVASGLNETYVVRYTMTTDGSTPADPTLYNGTEYTGPITITTPGTIIKARTFAKSCDNWYSSVVTQTFGTLPAPPPTITINETTQTITFDGNYNLSYTTDGTTPASSNGTQVAGDGSTPQTVTLSDLALGTTVKAITYKTDYTPSAVVSEFYSTGTTVTTSTVFLDDREDHSWSYYTDDSPIHSLNPADIKITYYGNGTGTVSSSTTATPADGSWTGNATSAMVGVASGESQNTFVYLKTLERENEGGTGNLPYTMIANPFQVRPVYTSSKGTDNATPISINVVPAEPEPQAIPEPVFVDPVMPEETEYSADRGNRSGTFKETFQNTDDEDLPAGWEGSKVGVLSVAPYVKEGTDLGSPSTNRYLRFRADAFNLLLVVVDGESMAVMPYYANIESIKFTYKVSNTSCTLYVGWYDGSNYQDGGQISLTSQTTTTVTLNSSNAATLLNYVNSREGGRIAFRLVSTSITERYLYLDDVTVTFTPKAPAFNYANGATFTGTTADITISRKDPSTVTYFKFCAADDNSTPSTTDGTWTRFPGNSNTVTVSADYPRLRAFAYHEASETFSAVTDATYNFTLRAPTFSHNGGIVNGTTQEVRITGLDAGTTVYYTMDGTDPLTSSTASSFPGGSSTTVIMGEYEGQVHTQLRAIAVANNLPTFTSDETNAEYTFTLSAPEITPAGGVYFVTGAFPISITSHGGTVHYTTDGTDPTESSPEYTGSFTITGTTVTVKAKAFSTFGASEVVTETYTFMQGVTNNDQYRGFYKWRVKSKSAGLTLLRSNGTTEVAVGETFDADEQVFFQTSNEYGNEVEFEALWARAYITTSTSTSSLNASVGVERNFMVLSSTPTPTNTTVTIGSGNTTTYGQYIPLYWNNANRYSITQQIYTASEIGQAGLISALSFYVNNSQNNPRSIVIYMKQTSESNFGSGSTPPMVPLSASDKVFTGNVNFSSTGWKSITLDTPFEYDGTSNIMVCVVDNTGTYSNNKITFRTYSTGQNRAWYNVRSADPVPLFDGGTYFTNGNVLTYNNQIRFTKTVNLHGNELPNLTVPCTVTSLYPNGKSESGTITKVSSALVCGADLKIESVELAGGTLNAATHNLTIGRGVTGSASNYVGMVIGTSGNKSESLDYTIRIESGWYKNFYLASSENATYSSGTVSAKAVLGCDYDRANNDNENLSIAANSIGGGNIYGGNGMSVSSDANKDNLTFDWYIKSGKYHDGILGSADGGDESIYLGSGQSTNYLYYIGKRRLTLEGGEMASIAGGMNSGETTANGNYNNNYTTATDKDNVLIRMRGGHVRGAIYGAAAFAGAKGGRTIVITGGEVNGWIAGGCNGTHNDGGELYGSTYIYLGGNARAVQTGEHPYDAPDDTRIGGNTGYGVNGAYGGNIFGAGCGIKPDTFVDQIDGTLDPQSDPDISVGKVFGSTIVVADNGELGRDIYGGGKFGLVADNSTGAYGLGSGNTDMTSRIYILGGTVHGDIMGGSQNQVHQNSEIYVRGGQLVGRAKNRPGDGYLNDLAYYGDVYGGSDSWGITNGTVKIEMTGGQVTNIFGGGYGMSSDMAEDVTITVSGGEVRGIVFGGGEAGTVMANTHVNINGGKVNDVFGGGKGYPAAKATITGQTYVNINGGLVNGSVYGGGENGDVKRPDTYEEAFTDYDAAAYDATTSHRIPDGWYRTCGSSGYVPRVSNSTKYSGIANYSGNYLLFSATGDDSTNSTALAVMPQYSNITSASFWYRNSSGSYGSLYLGYYVGNTFTSLEPLPRTATWTQYTLTDAQISTINENKGRIAFRYVNNRSGSTYSAAIDDVKVSSNLDLASIVTVSGGTVEGDVFGGGKMGKTTGNGIVTVSGGLVKLNVFGGALGTHGDVYFAGHKTVNILKGQIKGSVYGGSHDANDALSFSPGEFESSTITTPCSNINICGGQIDQHVYSAGYYGNTFGSVYTYIGLKAIEEAPNNNHTAMNTAGINFNKHKLVIKGNVWAGGDWGTFSGGSFGGSTITGHSNVYIDGLGYQSNDNNTTQEYYMKLKGSVMGCGTSADAGKGDVHLFVRNFGDDLPNKGSDKERSPFLASTEITSIQRWEKVRIENSHLQMVGQGRITSLDIAEKYSLYSISEELLIANGSSLVMNSPCDELHQLYSVKGLTGIYEATPTYTIVNYDGLGDQGSSSDNKIRINNGSFLKVRYTEGTDIKFGELKGFFHLMGDPENGTDIYARPKQSKDAPNRIPDIEDNPVDGGFVSYVDAENTYTAGTLTGSAFANVTDAPGTVEEGETGVQIPYENHVTSSKDDSQYYRIWRYGGNTHRVDAVLNAIADNSDYRYKTVTVDVKLPGWRDADNYYRFARNGNEGNYYTLINYGYDVLTFNAANYQNEDGGVPFEYIDEDHTESREWMSFNGTVEVIEQTANDRTEGLNSIEENPNLNFGLVVKPNSGMSGTNHIICSEATNYLTGQTFGCNDVNVTPTLSFELTFSNNLRSTRTNDPIIIPMEQCDAEGNVLDVVNIYLTIATSTELTLGSEWKMYAIMDGNNTNTHEEASLRVEIPKFEVNESGKEANFYIKSADFTPRIALNSSDYTESSLLSVGYEYNISTNLDLNKFGLTLMPVKSTVSSDTWRFITDHELDAAPGSGDDLPTSEFKIGENGGRSPVSMDLNLYYNANYDIETYEGAKPIPMGTVVYTLEFDNFKGGTRDEHIGTSEITVNIYRKGRARCFYVDGIYGIDALEDGRGDNPNYAAKSVNFVLNRCGYTPGDIIYIVNTVTTTNETTWNGSAFQNNVIIERYPGGHELSEATDAIPSSQFDNNAFTGTMVDVQGNLNINGVTVDGHKWNDSSDPENPNSVVAEAPMFNVEAGGQLSLGLATTLQNNNNNANGDGGAVHVAYGGTLRMNENATITNNVSTQGGGVFMDGTMIVSDHVQVTGNTNTDGTTASNVWLAPIANAGENGRVIQVGTADNDGFGPLSDDALIGVHKTDWSDGVNGFMPILTVESDTEENLEMPYETQAVIVPDQSIYTLQRYKDPDYLYWTSTWITAVTSKPSGFNALQIDTPEELAWAISIVNGENGEEGAPNTNFTLTDDIDMGEHMWVPIGEGTKAYTGTFNGNGHTVTGIGSTLGKDDMGMFGATNGANIVNLVVNTNFISTSENIGTVVGDMKGGSLSNVEGAGVLTSCSNNYNFIGGLVGTTEGTSPIIHSSFAVVSVEGASSSVVGGLVGEHNGDLFNAYSNLVISDDNRSEEIGGLVGYNNGTVENCYSIVSDLSIPAFAYQNDNTIQYCYAATESSSYVGSGSAPIGPGKYGSTTRFAGKYGYNHSDQQIDPDAANIYVVNGTFAEKDPEDEYINEGELKGLLATLNKWVNERNKTTEISSVYYDKNFSAWTRTMASPINDDYPVLLIHPTAVCLGSKDGRVIDYKTDLNDMIQDYNMVENGGNIYLYDAPAEVSTSTDDDVRVYINENVGITQAADNIINARVGVTFDNTKEDANLWGKPYAWHMFSSALHEAPLGLEYQRGTSETYWMMENCDGGGVVTNYDNYVSTGGIPEEDYTDLDKMDPPMTTFSTSAGNIGYFPINSPYGPWRNDDSDEGFDFYCYSEPDYHWINFKREGKDGFTDHWHEDTRDGKHWHIDYKNEENLKDGKGYLMAIGKTSMLMADGVLNNGVVTNSGISYSDDVPFPGINLVGNPYQSYLNFGEFAEYEENISLLQEQAYYVVDADKSGYITYVNGGSDNPEYASRYIHPHQGFIVMVKEGTTTLTFNKDMRTPGANLSTFREEHLNYPLVNLICYDGNGKRDLTTVEINRPEVGGAGKMRALRISDALIYASFEQKDYQALFAPEGIREVPVRFEAFQDGVYTLNWSMFNGDFHYLHLIDNITGADIDLLGANEYKFEAHTSDYVSRFRLVFEVTGIDEPETPEPVEGTTTFAFQNGDELIVTGEGVFQLFDLNGRCLLSTELAGAQSSVALPSVARGMYLLRLTGNKQTQVQKIIIK